MLVLHPACLPPNLDCEDGTHQEDTECVPDEDNPPDTAEPTLDFVEHGYGRVGGEFTIAGSNLRSTRSVYVDGVEATIVTATSTAVVAVVPDLDEAVVDVQVTNDFGDTTLPDAMRVFQDGTGRVGAVGVLSSVITVGDYWSTDTTLRSAIFSLILPTDARYHETYAAELDTCNPEPDPLDLTTYDLGASTARLAGGTDDIALDMDRSSSWYEAYDLTTTQWEPDTVYDLLDLNTHFGKVDIPGIVATPSVFELTGPALDGDEIGELGIGDLDLTWEGGRGDGMFVSLELYNAASTSVEERVTCWVADDGSFNVPRSVWTGWTANRLLYVRLGRYQESTAVVPLTNSVSQVVGIYWLLGAAFTR